MAFHNVPPNGFPDIPDIEDLEAVQGDIASIKSTQTEQGTAITGLTANKAPKTDIAAAFSAESNYAVGDLVYYDGTLYECTIEHAAGEWAAADFTAASVGSALNEVSSNLSGYNTVNSVTAGSEHVTITSGGYIKIGKSVTVEVDLTTDSEFNAGSALLNDLPSPLINNPVIHIRNATTYSTMYTGRLSNGTLYPDATLPAGRYYINGAYASYT